MYQGLPKWTAHLEAWGLQKRGFLTPYCLEFLAVSKILAVSLLHVPSYDIFCPPH